MYKLQTIIWSTSLTSIGTNAFQRCTGLISLTLPIGLTSLGQGAFADCTSLTTVTIPASVTSIEKYAFMRDTALTSVTYLGSSNPTCGDNIFGESGATYADVPTGY